MTSYIASVKQNMIDIIRGISQTSNSVSGWLWWATTGCDMHHPSNGRFSTSYPQFMTLGTFSKDFYLA
jgi:hypothetical protein